MIPDTVGRLAVTWRPDADPDPAGRARLDGLVRALVNDGWPDGLGDAADRDLQVCVRRVVLPTHRMRWDADDSQLVGAWARVIERGVAEAVAAGGAEMVRYGSRTHARQDLVTALLRGERERVWAWRLLGLWPGGAVPDTGPGSEPADADVLRPVLGALGRDDPAAIVGLLVAVAGAGLLARLVATAGAELIVELVGAAWREAGGSGPVPPSDPATPDAVSGGAVSAGVGSGRAETRWSAGGTAGGPVPPGATPGAPVPGGPGADPAVARLCALVADRSTIAHALAGLPAGATADLVGALAVAAVLEVEPALAGYPVAAATALAWPSRNERRSRRNLSDGSAARRSGAGVRDPRPGMAPVAGPAHPATADGRPEHAAPLPSASTGWGGLLFLLPLVAELDVVSRVVADPQRFGPALRPVLHGLARRIVAHAVPDVGPADPDDPAVLAFAGLPPTAEPPTELAADILEPEVDALVAALRHRLGPHPDRDTPDRDNGTGAERAMLVAVCRRRAVVEADPGWIDVRLELDEVSLDVRRAGLDLDPGYLHWLGCVVRFRYG
jgi:hypothetical protein